MPDMLPSPPNGPFTADYEVEGFVARTLRGGEYRTSPTDRVRMTLRYGIILHGNAGNFMRQMEELRDQDILVPDWTQERTVEGIDTRFSGVSGGRGAFIAGLDKPVGRFWDADSYLFRWGDGEYVTGTIGVNPPPNARAASFATTQITAATDRDSAIREFQSRIDQQATITPIRRGRLRRLPQIAVIKSDLVQAEIEFIADVESQEAYAVRWAPPHFNGVPYLSLPPDMRSTPIRTFEDFVDVKEYGFGDADQTTEAEVTARQWDLPFRLDAAEASELISIFGACRGRFGSLWLPSWTEDWTVNRVDHLTPRPTGAYPIRINVNTRHYYERWNNNDIPAEVRERLQWLALQLPNNELLPVKINSVESINTGSRLVTAVISQPVTSAFTSLWNSRDQVPFSAFSLNRVRFGQDRLRLTFDAQGLCQGNARFVELPFEYNQPERKRAAVKTVSFSGSDNGDVETLPDVECESFIARNDSAGATPADAANAVIFPEGTAAGKINDGEKSIVLSQGQETRIYAQSPAEFAVRQPTTDNVERNGSLSLIIDTPDQDRPAWLYEFFEEVEVSERIKDKPLRLTSYWRTYKDGEENDWMRANIEHGDIEKNTTLDASEIEIMLNQKTDDFANDNRTNILWDIIERELHPVNLRFRLWEMPIRGLPKRLVFDGTVITVGRDGSDTLKISARDYFDFSNKRVGRTRLSVRCSAALFDQDCGVGWPRRTSPNQFQLSGTTPPSITSDTAPTLLPSTQYDKGPWAWRFRIHEYGDGNGKETQIDAGEPANADGKFPLETVDINIVQARDANYEIKGIPYVVGRFIDDGGTERGLYPTKSKTGGSPEPVVVDGGDEEFFVNGSIICLKQRRTIFKINRVTRTSQDDLFQVLVNIQFANLDSILEKGTSFSNLAQWGDFAVITAGCDKSWVTCHSRFSNTPRFRGAPRIPPKNPIITSLSEPAQPNSGKKGASGECA